MLPLLLPLLGLRLRLRLLSALSPLLPLLRLRLLWGLLGALFLLLPLVGLPLLLGLLALRSLLLPFPTLLIFRLTVLFILLVTLCVSGSNGSKNQTQHRAAHNPKDIHSLVDSVSLGQY